MPLRQRRVITGHDAQGRAVIQIDDVLEAEPSPRGTSGRVLWTTEGFPVDNDDQQTDTGMRPVETTLPGGSIFRVIEYAAGRPPRMHRTDSIDYGVIISGEIDLELDSGESAHLKAGDTFVQRGTIHNWNNHYAEPCVVAFILIDARSVEAGGQTLHPEVRH